VINSLFRFLIIFTPVLAAIAWGSVTLMENLQNSWLEKDLAHRSSLVFGSIEESLEQFLVKNEITSAKRLLNKISTDELVYGILVCPTSSNGTKLPSFSNEGLNPYLTCEAMDQFKEKGVIPLGNATIYMWKYMLPETSSIKARIFIFTNASPRVERYEKTRIYIFAFFICLGLVVVLVSTLIARFTISRPMRDLGVILRDVVSYGNPQTRLQRLAKTEFAPLIRDLLHVTHEVELLKGSHSHAAQTGIWTAKRLRNYVKRNFGNSTICVISNREPLIHNFDKDGSVDITRPASGLITGVEPILKACNGVWIAHGSGSADSKMVDANDSVRIPSESPEYTLRRVWLTKEEEEGHCTRFSNEGLWPLCLIAHQRPQFESKDWEQYRQVNKKFAQAFSKQIGSRPAVVLIQDYHFALLPKLIRDISPQSVISLFWHIPWPNPEVFGICPWRNEIIESMLAADVLGFHTKFHCNNFIDTVDRYVESRIDRELLNIQLQGHECRIRPFPISIVYGESSTSTPGSIREQYGLSAETMIGLGVERVDYTKGLPERIRGIRRFAERRPELAKKFVFIQIGSPSRMTIPAYRKLHEDIISLVNETNSQFKEFLGRDLIILKLEHHEPHQLKPYYEQSNICLVTSLHDGMNLVAKEFVAAREKNEDGVLLLSQFAGASRELREALILNPYGPEDIASKLIQACEMPAQEQRDRMRRMRRTVRENNVYKWAYLQLNELHDVQQMTSLGTLG
jgi:trehalose-6-phosphate synthase